jgi:bifunctional non-homologous end joining protein LigD
MSKAKSLRQVAKARAGGTAIGANVVMGVAISNPDKPLWPAAGDSEAVTKLELARYYECVAPWMLDHVRSRPCSIVRTPDGIDGERFFQRHAVAGTSSLVALMKVRGDPKPYLALERIEAFAALAQAAAVELHPWNCVAGDPEIPGRLVFDLDPGPELTFDAVVLAALEVRERLAAAGLSAFCKTTGGKGLHVVSPLAAGKGQRAGWSEAKAFAKALCVQMAADSPARYLLSMTKSERSGKIFLDYLRNDRMATAVAPLSPRARTGAPVSMPLPWPQVKKSLDPSAYSIRSAPSVLARLKPWRDYETAAVPLGNALRKGAQRRRS